MDDFFDAAKDADMILYHPKALGAAGEKPIVITFSSMPLKNPEIFFNKLKAALKNTNNRAVLLTGNSGIKIENDSNIYVVSAAPHTMLFPCALENIREEWT